jgi:hypothetical protein
MAVVCSNACLELRAHDPLAEPGVRAVGVAEVVALVLQEEAVCLVLQLVETTRVFTLPSGTAGFIGELRDTKRGDAATT